VPAVDDQKNKEDHERDAEQRVPRIAEVRNDEDDNDSRRYPDQHKKCGIPAHFKLPS